MADIGPSFPFRIEGGRTVVSKFGDDEISKIKESVLQIILTDFDERVGQTIGTVSRRLQFVSEPGQFSVLADIIQQDLEVQESRISDIIVSLNVEVAGTVAISIQYKIFGNQEVEQNFEVTQ